MKLTLIEPPREFTVGSPERRITLRDCGRLELEPDEQVTFVTDQNVEYDVARKSWGFYATPSLNGRLKQFGLRPALAKNASGRYYVLLCELGKESAFGHYMNMENMHVVCWLDDETALAGMDRLFGPGR